MERHMQLEELKKLVRQTLKERIMSEDRQPTQKEIETHALSMAKKYNVPFDIIMRHMWVESRYKTKARSSVDAYGLMQLMPKTAKGLAVDRNDWQQNIEGGAKYLRNIRRRLDKKAESLGVKEFKNPWHLVAMGYFTGEGNLNKYVFRRIQKQKLLDAYVDQNGAFDTVRYMRDQSAKHPDSSRREYLGGLLRYAAAVHDPNSKTQKRRLRRHPTYTIPIPKEYIHSTGLEDFALAPNTTDNEVVPPSAKQSSTVIYIGDSTTGGMSRHMNKILKKNNMNAHVFHVNGANAALMYAMLTGKMNPAAEGFDNAKKKKAMEIASKISKLKSEGPVSIRISTLGGNDAPRANSKELDNYIETYVKPLFSMVDEVGGSPRVESQEKEVKRKKINDRFMSAAKEVGVPYYNARGDENNPQSFGNSWSDGSDYWRRQAEERIKFSSLNKNLKSDVTPQDIKDYSVGKDVSPMGRFTKNYKSFLQKNPDFDFDNFYKEIEQNLGNVSYALPKHGADYVFGPEHMKAYKALQKIKNKPTPTPSSEPKSEPIPVATTDPVSAAPAQVAKPAMPKDDTGVTRPEDPSDFIA